MKGAPEIVIQKCSTILTTDEETELTENKKNEFQVSLAKCFYYLLLNNNNKINLIMIILKMQSYFLESLQYLW